MPFPTFLEKLFPGGGGGGGNKKWEEGGNKQNLRGNITNWLRGGGGGGGGGGGVKQFFLISFRICMLFPTFNEKRFWQNIEKCPFTYHATR